MFGKWLSHVKIERLEWVFPLNLHSLALLASLPSQPVSDWLAENEAQAGFLWSSSSSNVAGSRGCAHLLCSYVWWSLSVLVYCECMYLPLKELHNSWEPSASWIHVVREDLHLAGGFCQCTFSLNSWSHLPWDLPSCLWFYEHGRVISAWYISRQARSPLEEKMFVLSPYHHREITGPGFNHSPWHFISPFITRPNGPSCLLNCVFTVLLWGFPACWSPRHQWPPGLGGHFWCRLGTNGKLAGGFKYDFLLLSSVLEFELAFFVCVWLTWIQMQAKIKSWLGHPLFLFHCGKFSQPAFVLWLETPYTTNLSGRVSAFGNVICLLENLRIWTLKVSK